MFYLKHTQISILRIYTYNESNFPDLGHYRINLTGYPHLRQYVFKYTTVVFSSPTTHHLYLNNYTILGDNYFEKNISTYKKEILCWLWETVTQVTDEYDPTSMTQESLMDTWGGMWEWNEHMRYTGYKIGDHTFFGINKKSLALTRQLLDSCINANLKITLYLDAEDLATFNTFLCIMTPLDELNRFHDTDEYFTLLSLCLDVKLCA